MCAMRGNPSSNDSMAIKLDMWKAFDHIEWAFYAKVMLKLGFGNVGLTFLCSELSHRPVPFLLMVCQVVISFLA